MSTEGAINTVQTQTSSLISVQGAQIVYRLGFKEPQLQVVAIM